MKKLTQERLIRLRRLRRQHQRVSEAAEAGAEEKKKQCNTCGRTFDNAGWSQLPYVGIQHGGEFPLELRNCSCGSTLAQEVR